MIRFHRIRSSRRTRFTFRSGFRFTSGCQSPDVIHSFWVPQLAGKTDVVPGQLNQAWIRADKPGIYRGACGEYCGLQHAHMAFTIIADPPAQYASWAAAQRAEPPQADTANAAGSQLFARTCGGCHAVRGTEALGTVGPDLTHVASRLTIGAGLVNNDSSDLVSWVRNAQAMKPGVLMPPMDLRQHDIDAVVSYLQTLH